MRTLLAIYGARNRQGVASKTPRGQTGGRDRWLRAAAALLRTGLAVMVVVGAVAGSAAEPPSCEWVFVGGGDSHDKARAVAVNADGHVWVAAECVGDAGFGHLRRPSAGGMDMCLVRLDAAGSPLWVSGLGGSKTDRAYGVVVDASGHAYVTGHFESTDAVVNGVALPNAGEYDAYTAKFAPDGTVLWVRVRGGAGADYGHGIALDSQGHVVVTGVIGRDIFCTKYDADGDEIWHRTTTGNVSGSGHGVAVDGTDHIYVGGNAGGSGRCGDVAIESSTTAALVLKLTPGGEAIWASVIPGTPSALYHEITCDAQGRVWGAGMFKGRVQVAGETFTSGGEKDFDGLIVHLDAAGRPVWARHLHGPGTDYCLGVATDEQGTAFVCGDFTQDTSLAGHALATRGSGDIFLAAFGVDGQLDWVQQAGGKGNDSAYPLVFRAPGEIIIGGALAAPADFAGREVTDAGTSDLYAAKWRLPE